MESNLRERDCNEAPDCEEVKRPRILIVEDAHDLRNLLQIAFSHQDQYEADFAATGQEAINIFMQSFRCCENVGVLMDLVLPDVSGLRLMSAFRELEKGSSRGCLPARFGVLSGASTVIEGTDLLTRIGVTLRINKPYTASQVLDAIGPWLAEPAPDLYKLPSGPLVIPAAVAEGVT